MPARRGDQHGLHGVLVPDDLGEVAAVIRAGSGSGPADRRPPEPARAPRRARSPHRAAMPRPPRARRAPALPRPRFPAGTITVPKPAPAAASTAGRMPLIGRSLPSRPSSPRCTHPIDRLLRQTTRSAASAATAMPRSKPEPCFGSAAGDRLTVSLRFGKSNPELRSGCPHAVPRLAQRGVRQTDDDEAGRLLEMSASISTTAPRSPSSATECVRASGIRTPAAGDRSEPRRVAGARHRDRVDADTAAVAARMRFAPHRCQPPQTRQLLHGDRLERVAEGSAGAGFDLDEDEFGAVPDDEVDFAQRAAPIALDDLVAGVFQERGG